MVTLAAGVIIIAGMKTAAPVLVPILLSIFLAVITTPVLLSLQRRGLPTVIALLVLICLLAAILTIGGAIIARSLNELTTKLPSYQERLFEQSNQVLDFLEDQGMAAPELELREAVGFATGLRLVGDTAATLSRLAGNAFIILLITIFLLLEAAMLPAKFKAMRGLSDKTRFALRQMVENLRHYMGMKTVMSLLTGLLIGVLLFVMKVEYPILLGTLAFLLNYIPTIGSLVAAIPGIALSLMSYGVVHGAVLSIGYLAINVFVSNIIEPRFMGKELNLSPVVIVMSLILWGWVFGPIGMLLSVPLTMMVKIALESLEETHGLSVLLGGTVPEIEEEDTQPDEAQIAITTPDASSGQAQPIS